MGSLGRGRDRAFLCVPFRLGGGRRALSSAGTCWGEANAQGNLGVVCAALGQTENAIHHLQAAVSVADEIADQALAKRMRKRMTRINQSQG
jgi:exonuclease I